jgi:hypothetical protein
MRLQQQWAACRHHPTSCAALWAMLTLLPAGLLSSLKAAAVTWTSVMVRGSRQLQAALLQA